MNNLSQYVKTNFADFLIDTLNNLLIDSNFKDGLFLPFYPLSDDTFGSDFNYIYVEDLDDASNLESLPSLLDKYFDEFTEKKRILVYLKGKELKNTKFYICETLGFLSDAVAYKDTCGLNHMILAIYSQDRFKIDENGTLSLAKESYR